MRHYIDEEDNCYYIKDDFDNTLLKIEINDNLDQVIIETSSEVYAGPLELIKFKEN